MILIRKMRNIPESFPELEQYVQLALKSNPDNKELKEVLIDVYFEQRKYSTCIIIEEEIGDINTTNSETLIKIAKCYLRTNDLNEAEQIYRHIVNVTGKQDKELDDVFRLKMKSEYDDAEEDQEGLFINRQLNQFS